MNKSINRGILLWVGIVVFLLFITNMVTPAYAKQASMDLFYPKDLDTYRKVALLNEDIDALKGYGLKGDEVDLYYSSGFKRLPDKEIVIGGMFVFHFKPTDTYYMNMINLDFLNDKIVHLASFEYQGNQLVNKKISPNSKWQKIDEIKKNSPMFWITAKALSLHVADSINLMNDVFPEMIKDSKSRYRVE